ncbi:MAG TPA: 30S ribosomal protein S17 [Acidobacteriota bacterium]|nr:30S ribosomal protein S17 [Acidobacteriota bacterium]
MEGPKRGQRKTRTGIVVSDKMQRTIAVKIDRTLIHRVYGRVIRSSSKILAHDPAEQAGIGDRVLVMETRPLSKRKHWRLVEVLSKAK